MGPISAVNSGSVQRPIPSLPNVNQTGGSVGIGTGADSVRLAPAGASSNTLALTELSAAVTELLQSVGGGVENDELLRTLIVLLILLALLDNSQQEQTSIGRSAYDLLAGGRNAQAQSVFLYSSSTTIVIEQTTTMMSVGFSDGVNALAGGDQPQATGMQMDLSA